MRMSRAVACVASGLLALSACADSAPPPPPPADPAGRDSSPVPPAVTTPIVATLDSTTAITPDGWGPLRIGMTRADVVAAAGDDANPDAVGGPEPEACDEFRPSRAPTGMLVMVVRGRLTRVSSSGRSRVASERGVHVGDPAAAVRTAHGASVRATPHKYQEPPAEYLAVWRTAPPDTGARGILYEIGGDGRVTQIRGGGPSIEWVEGCA